MKITSLGLRHGLCGTLLAVLATTLFSGCLGPRCYDPCGPLACLVDPCDNCFHDPCGDFCGPGHGHFSQRRQRPVQLRYPNMSTRHTFPYNDYVSSEYQGGFWGGNCCVPQCAIPHCAVPQCAAPVCAAPPSCAIPPSCVVPTCAVPPGCAVPVHCAVPFHQHHYLPETEDADMEEAFYQWHPHPIHHSYARAPYATPQPPRRYAPMTPVPQAAFAPAAGQQMGATPSPQPRPLPGLENRSPAQIERLYAAGMIQQADGSWIPRAHMQAQAQTQAQAQAQFQSRAHGSAPAPFQAGLQPAPASFGTIQQTSHQAPATAADSSRPSAPRLMPRPQSTLARNPAPPRELPKFGGEGDLPLAPPAPVP